MNVIVQELWKVTRRHQKPFVWLLSFTGTTWRDQSTTHLLTRFLGFCISVCDSEYRPTDWLVAENISTLCQVVVMYGSTEYCWATLWYCRSIAILIFDDTSVADLTILFVTRIPRWWYFYLSLVFFHLYSLVPFVSDRFTLLLYAEGAVTVKLDIHGSEQQLVGYSNPNTVLMLPVVHSTIGHESVGIAQHYYRHLQFPL